MDSDTVIKVDGLYKKFAINLRRSLTYGTLDIARNMLGIPYDQGKLRKDEFWALEDVNFELKRGESLGIIGRNGSGKSTLLRTLTGIFPPDRGNIMVRGKVGSLIAVGVGFHPHMTGRENIYLNGTILGMSKEEIKQKFDDIVSFADIGQFLDAPVSTYSSGMNVRLGFAIAIHAEPEVLMIDEILAVGDMNFQQKCMAKLNEILEKGTAIILVTHQMNYVQNICKKGLLLEHGKVVKYGDSLDTIAEYYKLNSQNPSMVEGKGQLQVKSEFGVEYKNLKFINEEGQSTRKFKTGEKMTVEWEFDLNKAPVENCAITFSISDSPYTYNGYITKFDDIKISKIEKHVSVKLTIDRMSLSPGNYFVSLGLWDENLLKPYYWDYESTGTIEVLPTKKLQGRFELPHKWDLKID